MFEVVKTPFKYLVIVLLGSMLLFSSLEYIYTISLYNNLILNMNNAMTNAIILSSFKTPNGDTPYIKFSQFDDGGVSQAAIDNGDEFITTDEYRRDFSDEFGFTMQKVLTSVFHEDITLSKVSESRSQVTFVFNTNNSDRYVRNVLLTATKMGDASVRVNLTVRHGFRMPGMKRLNDFPPALNNNSIKIEKDYTIKLRQQV